MKEVHTILKTGRKQAYVQKMFSSAARRYDFVNSLLSARMHLHWKTFAIKKVRLSPGGKALDVCSGTMDVAIKLASIVGDKGSVTAVDLNEEMLEMGRQKVSKLGIETPIVAIRANAQDLPLLDNAFNVTTVAFGIRNVDDIAKGFSEMYRVLVPGGQVVCLEFTHPKLFFVRCFYAVYSYAVLPWLGKLLSGDKTGIYYYLPRSIRRFPNQDKLKEIMEQVGFKEVEYFNLSGGIAAVHVGIK